MVTRNIPEKLTFAGVWCASSVASRDDMCRVLFCCFFRTKHISALCPLQISIPQAPLRVCLRVPEPRRLAHSSRSLTAAEEASHALFLGVLDSLHGRDLGCCIPGSIPG